MWVDSFIKFLLPREDHFFDLLEKGANCAMRCSALLEECCKEHSYEERVQAVEQMRELEHEADRVIVEVYEALNKTFVTPIDRSDIYTLSTDLEDITDDIFAIALQIVVHAIDSLPKGSEELASYIHQACKQISSAVSELRNMRQLTNIRSICKSIYKIEHDGDQIFRLRISELFREEKDAIQLIKHKEFLEGLERTLDACDDMGNALETIVIKNT